MGVKLGKCHDSKYKYWFGSIVNYLAAFAKSVSRTPVTKTTSNVTGDETLTAGSAGTVQATFFKRDNVWNIKNPGLIEDADAIMMVSSSQTLNKDDIIGFDGETFRVNKVINRKLGTTDIMKTAWLFQITWALNLIGKLLCMA